MNTNVNPYYNDFYETYPNQKQIKIIRDNVSNSKEIKRQYIIAYQDNLIEAMKCLTPSAFKVYVCLLFNANGYKLRFSPENIHNITGLCKDTIRKAMKQLEEQGYLESIDFYRYVFSENRNLVIDTNNW